MLDIDTTSEKALFRAAQASYWLGRFAKSSSYLAKLIEFYPGRSFAIRGMERCEVRSREQSGNFDFASMLDEAIKKKGPPLLDRASYLGAIEVRKCAIESHGRGLFTTKAVKAGELLLCEKAFAAAFALNSSNAEAEVDGSVDTQSDVSKWKQKIRQEIVETVSEKLLRSPSAVSVFADLYPGPVDEDTGVPESAR